MKILRLNKINHSSIQHLVFLELVFAIVISFKPQSSLFKEGIIIS